MGAQTKNFLCGRCNTPVVTVANPKDKDMVTCPKCGNSDTFKNVMKIVQEGVNEATAKRMQEMLKGIAAGSKSLKFKGSPIQQRKRRFYVKLDI